MDTIAFLLYLGAFIPYIISIFLLQTRPVRVTWIIWTVADVLVIFGMESGLNGQILAAFVGDAVVAGLSLKYGKSGWNLTDKVCLVGAVVGVFFWQLIGDSNIAVIAGSAVIFIASVPTMVSAWSCPHLEDKTAWTLFWVSCIITVYEVSSWTVVGATQPIVFLFIESIMMFLLFVRPLWTK